MIVIANKTEIKLLKNLQRHVQDHPVQKCFYMEFSKTTIDKKDLFETFLKLLESFPNSYMAQVYLCRDKDIFIMMEGFVQSQFLDFIQKLSIALDSKDFINLIEAFEIGIHWKKIEQICKDKIQVIDSAKNREEEEQRKEQADKITLDVFKKLDTKLISNLVHRRNSREDIKIMVVDDDQLSRTLVGNVLSREFPVSYAKNGADALSEYLICAPDVLFLDIGLPDISGHEVLECLFQFDPDAYVIMFSGRKDKKNIVRALETGAQGFVAKPFTRNKLFEYIQKSPFVMRKKNASPRSQNHVR